MSPPKEKRQRKRVPVSCLNCKKRKVKCDKLRPCSGCVKNNVGHLCVYVEPVWANNLAEIAAAEAPAVNNERPKDLEYNSGLETTIAKQESELKCLRAQLAQLRSQKTSVPEPTSFTLDSQGLPRPPNFSLNECPNAAPTMLSPLGLQLWLSLQLNTTVVSVLTKIHPFRSRNNSPTVVINDLYGMKNFADTIEHNNKNPPPSPLSLYSWLNIIRLDPQLTALWYKITNLQKSYHQYKNSLQKQLPTDSRFVNLSYSANSDSSCKHHTCPVVACEFNTMLEESDIRVPKEGTKSESPPARITLPGMRPLREEDEDAVDMLTLLQTMWSKVKQPSLMSSPLIYSQLDFLVRLYFNKTESCPYKQAILSNDVESRNLLQSFELQIRNLFKRDKEEINLNVGVFASNISDDQMLISLRVKVVYMSMLCIIVEEATESLRSQNAMSKQYKHSFSNMFPPSFFSSSNDSSKLSALAEIIELIKRIGKARTCKNDLQNLLAFLSLVMATLNCLLQHYGKEDLPLNLSESFTTVFQILLDGIEADEGNLQLWCDPSQILFEGGNGTDEETLELRILFCQLWSDLVRIINKISLNFTSILKHTKKLDRQVYDILKAINQAERENVHIKYLDSVFPKISSESSRGLPNTLKVGYLISKSSYRLLNAIHGNPTTSQVSISEVSSLLSQISVWVEDISLSMLPLDKYFELRLMLQYLELFFMTVLIHQGEEIGDVELVSKLIPTALSKCLDINKFLQGSCVQFGKTLNPTTILAIIAEALGRMSHLVAGLLIRFRAENQGKNTQMPEKQPGVLYYGTKSNTQTKITITVDAKDNLIDDTDKTIFLLEKHAPIDIVIKKTKIWKFYTTFIRNSHKMNSESYAKLHSEALQSGKFLNVCPVMPSSNYTVSATRTETGGCPVAHDGISGLLELRDSRNGTPSISKIISSNRPESAGAKRCPVTHADSNLILSNMPSRIGLDAYPSIPSAFGKPLSNFLNQRTVRSSSGSSSNDTGNESTSQKRRHSDMLDSRGRVNRFDESNQDNNFSAGNSRCAPPLCANDGSTFASSQRLSMPLPLTPAGKKLEQLDVIDWDSLPDFNFDFIGDESLMFQVNNGDISNLLSDSLY